MKKSNIFVAIVLGMACSGAYAAGELGELNFIGKVAGATCAVDTAGTTAAINFGALSATRITFNQGKVNNQIRPFKIKLTGCPAGSTILVKFEGDLDLPTRSYKASGAKNIAAIIYEQGQNEKVPGNVFVTAKTSNAGVNDLDYEITLTRWKNETLEPGDFTIPINYSMSYQ